LAATFNVIWVRGLKPKTKKALDHAWDVKTIPIARAKIGG
jgi:hypothetical protein